ncbi:hypothetical protein EKK58_12690 [Candidatus Dependentiae bacterium]|nr:MAG: hypothetical protein EKK58_12690 [Candidatus Dependentiae bacterium]
MNYFLNFFGTLYVFTFYQLHAENTALYASFFNATYNCSNPLVLNGTVTVYLDEDININGCLPFVAGPLLSPTDQLIFTSTNNCRVVITSNTIVDFATFLTQGQTVIITGNGQLIVEKGAYLIFNNNTLLAKKNGRIIFIESST